MLRTQISLTTAEREILDMEVARTGRSLSALIRDAVELVYGARTTSAEDVARIRQGFGGWKDRDFDGQSYVEQLRSSSRLTAGRP